MIYLTWLTIHKIHDDDDQHHHPYHHVVSLTTGT